MNTPNRILLIEDDADDAEYLRAILAEDGRRYQIKQAETLKQALTHLRKSRYDIVLADLSLPDSRGVETFSEVSKHAINLPILVLTGLDDEEAALSTLRKGAQDYLVKGQFNGPFLAKSIQYAIERHKIHRELEKTTEQLSDANQKLDRLAHNDPLTNLLNRRGLEQALMREVAWANRHGSSIMALIIDLDDFKSINDTLGHAAGDTVLKELAMRIQEPLRSTDFAARIGGDEFLILLPDTETSEGIGIAEKVRRSIAEKPFYVAQQNLRVTASVGAVPLSGDMTSIDDLLAETHDVLYQSKRHGKNRVSFDEKRKDRRRLDRADQGISAFLEKSGMYAVSQPIYDLMANAAVGYEFLSRASVPSLEKPDDFFRLAMKKNSLVPLDRRCLAACLKASAEVAPHFRRHFNLSPSTILETPLGELTAQFPKVVEGKVCIEISQQQIVGDPSYLAAPLAAFKKAGFLIAIENVTFGQNSLESLILLQPDFVKVDRHHVMGISKDPARMRSLKRLLKMAQSLGVEVIAHGIESSEDLEAIKAAGVKYGQGFLWGTLN